MPLLPYPIPYFPSYSGPYKVGTTEYEIPVTALDSAAPCPPSEVPISTVLCRVFYPAGDDGDTTRPVYWIPDPQREFSSAGAEFLGLPKAVSSLLSFLPNYMQWIKIPAFRDASVKPADTPSKRWPVIIFSHGIGGTRNMYSYLLGCLASHGIVVFAPEHRDGSAPISYLRQSNGHTTTVPYESLPHRLEPAILERRHAQMRIRLWELGLVFDLTHKLDRGYPFTSLSAGTRRSPSFASLLDVHSPGSICWAGHSYGAASVVQFVKSIHWSSTGHTESAASDDNFPTFRPLYQPQAHSRLTSQITPKSPLVLLDLWNLPLLGDDVRWLWEKPLPCYALEDQDTANVLALLSDEFYKWKAGLKATRFVLSNRTGPTSTADSDNGPKFFYAVKSAHLSQSDAGVLFPWIMKRFRQAEEPQRTIRLNVAAILQMLKESGVSVQLDKQDSDSSKIETKEISGSEVLGPNIFAKDGSIRGWSHIPLVYESGDEGSTAKL